MEFHKWEILVMEVEHLLFLNFIQMLFLFKQWKEIIILFFLGAPISYTFFIEFHISIGN